MYIGALKATGVCCCGRRKRFVNTEMSVTYLVSEGALRAQKGDSCHVGHALYAKKRAESGTLYLSASAGVSNVRALADRGEDHKAITVDYLYIYRELLKLWEASQRSRRLSLVPYFSIFPRCADCDGAAPQLGTRALAS